MRLSIPLRWKTIDRSHFSRSYLKPLRGQLPNRSPSSEVTAPVKTYVIVIYRPPGQQGDFVHELDTLLSSIPEQECPTLILGDKNIHLDNPNSADFRTLVHSFDLQQVPTPPTQQAGKELNLILARNCTTDNLTVTPLHCSDHFFTRFDVRLIEQPSVPPPMVSFRRNLRNLSPTHFSSLVSSRSEERRVALQSHLH